MSLTDKLLDLDEAIWKQFEKVTQYANKELGWNKYDLVRLTEISRTIPEMGAMLYCGILGYKFDSGFAMGMGSLGLILVPVVYSRRREESYKEEKLETGNLFNAVVHAPVFKPLRPLGLVIPSILVGKGVNILSRELESKNLFLTGMALSLMGSSYLFETLSSYFQDQIMTPPTKKKSVWSYLSERITKPFKPEPVKLPTVDYQSIDDVVYSSEV